MGTLATWMSETSPDVGPEIAALLRARAGRREREVARVQKAWEKRQDYLARPDLIERDVATHATVWSMRPGKPRYKRDKSMIATLERREEDTPQAGFATELYKAYVEGLENPELLGYSQRQLLAATAEGLMLKPGEDKRPRIEKGWEFKRRADTALEPLTHPFRTIGRLAGMEIEDPEIKEPPGYERWLRAKRGKERVELGEEGYLATPGQVAGAAALGAPFGIPGGPVGMGAAAVGTAALETVAHPFRRFVSGTEWYRARKSPRYAGGIIPTTWEGLKAGLVRTGPELVAFPSVLKRAARMTAPKLVKITSESIERAIGIPTAENILAKAAIVKKATKPTLAMEQILGDTFEAGWPGAGRFDVASITNYWKGVLTAPKLKATFKVKTKTPGQKAFLKLRNNEAVEAALMHPEGVEIGAIEALSGQTARGTLLDLRQMNKAYDLSKFPPTITTVGERKIINKALGQVGAEDVVVVGGKGGAYLKKAKVKVPTIDELEAKVTELEGRYEALIKSGELAEVKGITAEGKAFIRRRGHPDPVTTGTIGEEVSKSLPPAAKEVVEKVTAATDVTKAWKLSAKEKAVVDAYRKAKKAKRAKLSTKELELLEQEMFEGGIRSKWLKKNLAFALGAFGVGAAAWRLFAPSEVEAAGLPPGVAKIMGSALAKRFVAPLVEPGQMLVKAENFARGLPFPKGLGKALKVLGAGKGLQYKLMSPGSTFRDLIPARFGKGAEMAGMNPGIYKASYMGPEFGNALAVVETMGNVLDAAGIESAFKLVAKDTEFLIPLMRQQVLHDVSVAKLGYLTRQLKKKPGKGTSARAHARDVRIVKDDIAKAEETIEGLKPAIAAYHRKHSEVMQAAADRYPSIRIALALDDAPNYTKYPWLKGKLTYSEEVAAGRMREQLLQYRVRYEERGIPVIKGPYLHHLAHPKFTQEMQAEIAEGAGIRAAAFTKFYSRTANSRPLVPDIWATMRSYIYDTERRIQNTDFWRIGEKDGWYAIMNHPAVQDNPGLKHAFEAIWKGTSPVDRTWGNRFAQTYAVVDVMKRLFLNPSAGLKHLIKVTGDAASAGWPETIRAMKPSLTHLGRRGIRNLPQSSRKSLSKMGIGAKSEQDKVFDSFYSTIIHPRNLRQVRLEMGIDSPAQVFEMMSGLYGKTQTLSTSMINIAELFDRGISVSAGVSMAAKRGMTTEQALYGIYDIILKNNFLSRELNPTWAIRPKIRALFMFQLTPYKILERRAVMAHRTGRAIKGLGKDLFKASKTPEGRTRILQDLLGIRRYVKGGEQELKANVFVDALRSEIDFFGTPVVQQLAREIAMIGAGTYVGATAGMSLWHHFVHLPFLSAMHDEPTLALSPGPMAIIRGINDWKRREDYDDELVTTKILQRWFNKVGPLPDMVRKVQRLSSNDIPDIYKESHFRYLFAIPGAGEH
jgi:hypothetical protein